MLNFVSVARQLPRNDIVVLAKTINHKTVLAMLDSKYGSWVVQDFRSAWYICDKGHVKSWAYIEDDKTDDDNNFVYRELIKAKQEIDRLNEVIKSRERNVKDIIKSLGVDDCPICDNDNWFNEYDSYPVPKGMLRCSQCGYLKSKYQSEFVVVPRDIYSQLVEARKEIVLLKDRIEQLKSVEQKEDTTKLMYEISEFVKEMKNAPKSDGRNLTELEVREIIRDEIRQGQRVEQKADEYKIISITPIMDSKSKWPYSYFDISVYGEKPKIFTRYTNGNWATVEGYLPESESKKLEKLYKKMMGFNV